jgi:P27 family predicted phage terminase small subunit
MARPRLVSDKQKKLQGHGRFVKNVPSTKPIQRLWPIPSGLKAPGKRLWKTVGRILVAAKALTDLDYESFSQLAFTYDSIHDLRKTLANEGWTTAGRTPGSKVKHPAAVLLKSAMADFKWLSEKFGLNPLDRSRLSLPVDSNPEDKTRDFLFGGKK